MTETPQTADREQEIRADVLGEVVAWLVKKAREKRARGPQYAKQADTIGVLADKVSRGAVRPDNLLTLPPGEEPAPEDVPALLAENERLRRELGTAVSTVAEQAQRLAKREREHDADREERDELRAELAARPTRAAVLREAAPELDAICQEYGVLGVGDRMRRMADAAERDDAGKDTRTAGESTRAGAPLDEFEAVISTSNGSYGVADEYRCRKCGAIGAQGTDAKSLLELTEMASRHECLPSFPHLAAEGGDA